MKTILALLLTLAANQAFAATYQCTNIENGTSSTLNFEGAEVRWSEDFHSASSGTLNLGIEDASYSKLIGYQLFKLIDFYKTEDSANILALSQALINEEAKGQAVTYFDNDGLEEEMTTYNCELQ